jgi:lipopolysaccharide export system protein LptA
VSGDRGGGRGWRLILILRKALVVLLAATGLVIAIRFATHWRRPDAGIEAARDLPPQKIATQEGPRYREFNRDLSRMEIKAARNSLGPDGLYHLEGEPGRPVTIVDRGAKGGRDLRFTAARVDYDKDWTRAAFLGGVAIETRGMTWRAEAFDYDEAADLIRSRSPVTVEARRFRARAPTLDYRLGDDTTRLSGGVRITARAADDGGIPYEIRAERMVFSYAQRRARLEGGVRLTHGPTRGRADAVELQLFPDRDDIHILWLMGGVTATVREKGRGRKAEPAVPPAAGDDAFRPIFRPSSREQDVSADQLMLTVFPDAPTVNILRSRGRAAFVLTGADGTKTRLTGDAVRFSFHRDGKLETMNLSGASSLTVRDPAQPGETRLVGSPINRTLQAVRLFGRPDAPALLAGPGREIRADWIFLNERNNNVNAEGRLIVTIQPEEKDPGREGFFKPGHPAFLSGGFLNYVDETRRFEVQPGVRMWQDDRILEAAQAVLSLESEALSASGGVRFQFVRPAGEGRPAAPVTISSDRMDFDPATRRITFRDKGRLRTREADLRAQTLIILPGEEAGKARAVTAQGGVMIKKGDREAFGEAAEFDVDRDAIVLTGNPYLVDKERGTIRGDKLTFRLTDGTIEVENRSKQQAEILIKS